MSVNTCPWSGQYHASYTRKDLILYALAIGFESNENDEDSCYTFEEDPQFDAVPTFCFVLPTWANRKPGESFSHIQPFPTPLMSSIGLIPEHLVKEPLDPSSCFILHTHQSVIWHKKLPLPSTDAGDKFSTIDTLVSTRTVAVVPKKIGAFVNSETKVRSINNELLCTLASTMLILGIDERNVQPLLSKRSHVRKQWKNPSTLADFEWTYTTFPNQALLYRLASGDFNKIHVRQPKSAFNKEEHTESISDRPILHGLCTLGIAFRGICRMLVNEKIEFISLEARFTKPVFVGDTLVLRAWHLTKNKICFQVTSKGSGATVVDEGEVIFQEDKRPGILSKM